MSIDSHIKLDGVKGESTHAKHKDEIDVLSWNWSVHNSSCTQGGGSAVGKGTPGMLKITKRVDKSSPEIAKKCAQGKHFKDAGEKAIAIKGFCFKNLSATASR